MTEKPLLFSAEMVNAILAGRKTQTRRLVKLRKNKEYPDWPVQPLDILPMNEGSGWVTLMQRNPSRGGLIQYPLGSGDQFWVKENFRFLGTDMNRLGLTHSRQDGVFEYAADKTKVTIERPHQDIEKYMKSAIGTKGRPSIFMPRWLSRISLDIVAVRVERLQNIRVADAKAEGVSNVWEWSMVRNEKHPEHFQRGVLNPYIANYSVLWDSLNKKSGFGWDVNPWVWVIEFKKHVETGEQNA